MKRFRGIVMFGIACFTSPCCTPLIVPILITVLAGTPVAVWLGQNLGLVYGVLTLISIVSFGLGIRWMNQRKAAQPSSIRPTDIPVISTFTGETAHVE